MFLPPYLFGRTAAAPVGGAPTAAGGLFATWGHYGQPPLAQVGIVDTTAKLR
ncbi:MAG: hypothetical protein R3E68_08970 [Burkholderiaceae bacterium]